MKMKTKMKIPMLNYRYPTIYEELHFSYLRRRRKRRRRDGVWQERLGL